MLKNVEQNFPGGCNGTCFNFKFHMKTPSDCVCATQVGQICDAPHHNEGSCRNYIVSFYHHDNGKCQTRSLLFYCLFYVNKSSKGREFGYWWLALAKYIVQKLKCTLNTMANIDHYHGDEMSHMKLLRVPPPLDVLHQTARTENISVIRFLQPDSRYIL